MDDHMTLNSSCKGNSDLLASSAVNTEMKWTRIGCGGRTGRAEISVSEPRLLVLYRPIPVVFMFGNP